MTLLKTQTDSVAAEKVEGPKVNDLFKPIEEVEEGQGIKALIYGQPECGKSFFGMSFPGPIYAISTETGLKKIKHHFPDKEIHLLEATSPFATASAEQLKKNDNDEPFIQNPLESLEKIEAATMALKDVKGGTIIIDSISDVWNWLQIWLKYAGKRSTSKQTGAEFMMQTEWQRVNEKFRWLMMRLNMIPCHVVLTSRVKPEYDGDGKKIVGAENVKSAGDQAYFVDFVIHVNKIAKPKPGNPNDILIKRMATIEKCRQQSMSGVQIEDITFDKLKAIFAEKGLENLFEIK